MSMGVFSVNAPSEGLAILAALSDLDAKKAILIDLEFREAALVTARADVNARSNTLNSLASDLAGREAALVLGQRGFAREKTTADADLLARGAALAEKEIIFKADEKARTDATAKARAAVTDRENAVSLREGALGTRESEVAAREDAIGAREAAADARQADAEAALARVRALAAG